MPARWHEQHGLPGFQLLCGGAVSTRYCRRCFAHQPGKRRRMGGVRFAAPGAAEDPKSRTRHWLEQIDGGSPNRRNCQEPFDANIARTAAVAVLPVSQIRAKRKSGCREVSLPDTVSIRKRRRRTRSINVDYFPRVAGDATKRCFSLDDTLALITPCKH